MSKHWWTRLTARPTAPARRVRPAVEALDDRAVPAVFATGSDPGSAPTVTIYDAATNQAKFTVTPFDPAFTGGVSVAVGDVTGDGTPDVLAAAGPGGGPLVAVIDGATGTVLQTLVVGDEGSRGGATVAAADVNRDGKADTVVGTIAGGVPVVRVLNYSGGPLLRQYTPFAGTAPPSVGAGDVTGDGVVDIVAGGGPGAGPRVVAFDGSTSAPVMNFFAFEESFTGGVQVSVGDVTGDGKADIVAAAGVGGGPRVQVFTGGSAAILANFFAYDPPLRHGVRAGVSGSGTGATVVTTNGPGQPADPRAFNPTTGAQLDTTSFPAVPASSLFDTVAPTVTVSSTAPATTTSAPIPFSVTFSEAVNGFSAAGLAVENGTVGGFTVIDTRTFSFTVAPAAGGAVNVSVKAGSAFDAAGNTNAASAAVTRTYNLPTSPVSPPVSPPPVSPPGSPPPVTDPLAPSLTSSESSPSKAATIPVAVTFPSNVSGFGINDVVVANGTATNFTVLDGRTYRVDVAPAADGVVTVTVPAGAAGYDNGTSNAAASFAVVSDRTPPTAAIAVDSPATSSPVVFTVTVSEDPTADLTADNLTVTNGTIFSVAKSAARTYRVAVIPGTGTDVGLGVKAKAFKDAAGNELAADVLKTTAYSPTVDAGGLSPTIPSLTPETWSTRANGLRVRDEVIGTGAEVQAGQVVTIQYSGWLLDGTRFDSSVPRGQPSTFDLDGLIQGWQQGIPGMKAGGVRDLYIPAALAYGSGGTGSIPPNSDLVFQIKLLSFS